MLSHYFVLLIRHSINEIICPNCRGDQGSFDTATRDHRACITWSCRHLHDYHSLFAMRPVDDGTFTRAFCRLCRFSTIGSSRQRYFEIMLLSHAEEHSLRVCKQNIFATEHEFVHHLENEHGAGPFWPDTTLDPWESLQYMERHNGEALIRSAQLFERNEICASKQPKHIVTVIGV